MLIGWRGDNINLRPPSLIAAIFGVTPDTAVIGDLGLPEREGTMVAGVAGARGNWDRDLVF